MVWAHAHSAYSTKDALPQVPEIVTRAKELNYPAMALTDHGTIAGVGQLYTECKKAGIEPLPGIEAYVAFDRASAKLTKKRADTFHMCMLALTQRGYRNLVALHNMMHRNYYYQPIIDLADLAEAANYGLLDDIYGLSGCWFGFAPKSIRQGNPEAVMNMIYGVSQWFGGGFAIELQNHQIKDSTHDDELHVKYLWSIAQKMNLPVIITQDSHYVHKSDRSSHDMLKWISTWGTPGDGQFPGELGYHMVSFDEIRHLYPTNIWNDAMSGLNDLASRAKVTIPELDTFRMRVPDVTVSGDPESEMKRRVFSKFNQLISEQLIAKTKVKLYKERIDAEFEVINTAGFAGYLMLVAEICDELTRRNITWAPRGSASGSIVVWLLGISQLDPIKWKLRFDRFLSSDRTKPPDIDIDMDPEFREDIIAWLESKFYVLRVGAWAKYGLYEESDVLYDPDKPQRGSLPSDYWFARRKLIENQYGKDKKKWPAIIKAQLDEEIPPDDWHKLTILERYHSYRNYSTHAAGLIITADQAELDLLPQMRVTGKDYMVSSFDKDGVEKMGFVKLDLLNVSVMTALRVMQEVSGVQYRTIPLNDHKTFAKINRGEVTGVFQLEGWTTANGLKRLRPRNVNDIIAAMALFRPATMDSGATDDYLNRRSKKTKIPDRHRIIADTTSDTYGILLYQEQAIEIFRLLGMEIEEIEAARTAIKASNKDVKGAGETMAKLMIRVRELATKHGMNALDVLWLEETLKAFAGYSFNRAHATSYGLLAYVTAWYAANHPVAFWAGMLYAHAEADEKRIRRYITAAQADGVNILSPSVNVSKANYSVSPRKDAIYKGLLSIKNVGVKAAENIAKNAPFSSFDDFALRVSSRTVTGSKNLALGLAPQDCGGVVEALHKAGAFRGLTWEKQEIKNG